MLRKLMKYELKATARFFLPLYLCFALATVLLKLFISFGDSTNYVIQSIFGVFIIALYVISVIALFVMVSFLCCYRFYKNIYSDEGYLTLTLPASVDSQILSKLFITAIWAVLTAILIIISILIFFVGTPAMGEFATRIPEMFRFFMESNFSNSVLGLPPVLFMFEFAILLILSVFSGPLLYYLCFAIGGLSNSHKVLSAIGAYFAITIAVSFVSNIFGTVVSVTSPNFLNHITMGIAMLGAIGLEVLQIIICYFITRYILERKTNI